VRRRPSERAGLRVAVILAAASAGCSRLYESPVLWIRYQPPRGFKFVAEESGPLPTARFSPDLEIRSIPGAPGKLDEDTLAKLLAETLSAASLPAPGRIVSSRVGTLPAGPVARYVADYPSGHALIYVIPDKDRRLLVTFTANDPRYAELETRVEMSLATLRITR
jgi:hypothetical protein